MKPFIYRTLLNLYPPYLGAGIRVAAISSDYRDVQVRMKLRFYNRNYMGTHFGGSLYAMIDPFYTLMLIQVLGREYIVWDKAAAIEFIKPGRGTVQARFVLTDRMIADICARTADGDKYLPEFHVDITNGSNEVVARGRKTVYIRRKQQSGSAIAHQ